MARLAVSVAAGTGYETPPALLTTANGVITAGAARSRVLMWKTGPPRAST